MSHSETHTRPRPPAATKSTPSGTSSSTCSTNLLCCETIGSNSDSHYKDLATSCGAKLSGSQSGATCSKLSSASAQWCVPPLISRVQ